MYLHVKTILIVDDQPLVRLVLSKSLRKFGEFTFLEAGNGKEAYNIICQHKVDMIFCDLNMPGTDGLYLLQQLMEPRYSGGIVLISGEDEALLNSTKILSEYYNLSVLGIASKPITSKLLINYLKQAEQNSSLNTVQKQQVKKLEPTELSKFIADDKVAAYFQTQYDIQSLNPIGFEALARIQTDDSIIFPDQFISVAEQTGLINELTKSVITAALSSFAKLDVSYQGMTLSLNISSKVLEDENFPHWLSNLTMTYGIANQSIVCELTETMLSDDPSIVHVALIRLRMLKFKLSIDDFGTGYASLSQLHALPFDELKIDRSFVNDMTSNEKSHAVCSRSLSLAKDLGLTSVAEGIENKETLDCLQQLGCDVAQGYFLARPKHSDDVVDALNTERAI